jgi:hypothetical protein
MKKTVIFIFAAAMLLSFSLSGCTSASKDKSEEASALTFEAVIDGDTSLLPFDEVFEALGYVVSHGEYDGVENILARRGLATVSATIGSDEVYVDGENLKLDEALKNADGKTLVSDNLFSKGLKLGVVYEGTKAYITEESKFEHETEWKGEVNNIKSDDGETLLTMLYSYPTLVNDKNDKAIDEVNSTIEQLKADFVDELDHETLPAEDLYENNPDMFVPEEVDFAVDFKRDKNNILSLITYKYYNLGGAHPTTSTQSIVFDMKNGKKMSLEDVLNFSENKLYEFIYDKFEEYFVDEFGEYQFEQFIKESLESEMENIGWYVTDDTLVLYFNPYQVTPYAMGTPTVEISYDGNENLFRKGIF